MVNWKVVLWCGVGGFALSFLVGIIGGVMFGALVLRAFLWGLVFAALGAASYYVISRFLPELVAGGGQGPSPDTGENVDIVIPDENPHVSNAEDPDFAEEMTGEPVEPVEAGGMVEEVEEVQPEEPAQRRERPERDSFFSEISDNEDGGITDELPEFEGEAEVFGRTAGPRASRRTSAGADVAGADPEEVARAIRTVLKKDQKG